MVYVIGSVEVVPGKMKEAQEWLRRYCSRLKKAFGVTAQPTQPVNAPPGQGARLGTIETFESPAAWGIFSDKSAEDNDFQALIREAFEEKQYFVRSSLTRTLHRVI